MNAACRIALLATGILLGISGCTSVPNDRAMRPLPGRTQAQTPAASDRPSRVRFLLLNPHDTSGWIAYEDGESADTEMYRVVVVRESTGELLYDGRAPLSVNLRESGFEMDEGDPRFQELIQAADRHFVTPLMQVAPAPTPQATPPRTPTSGAAVPRRSPQTRPQPAPSAEAAPAEAPETTTPLPQRTSNDITLIETSGDIVKLNLGTQTDLSAGQRMFMRTPPEILVNPVTQEETVLSRGQITALLEIISVDENRAEARILDGEVPEDGYFELAD